MSKIQKLIDKKDTFEVVRDLVAQILADESASQQALATADGKDPKDWELRVFTERSNPWDDFQKDDPDTAPIVNVWYDGSTFNLNQSNVIEQQTGECTINVDVYAYGVSEKDPSGGHFCGDEVAALESQRATRLVRNIMMSSYYTRLGIAIPQNIIGRRWLKSINPFQPVQGQQYVQNVIAVRLEFGIDVTEFSPQYEGVNIETIAVDIERAEDGSVIAQAQYNY